MGSWTPRNNSAPCNFIWFEELEHRGAELLRGGISPMGSGLNPQVSNRPELSVVNTFAADQRGAGTLSWFVVLPLPGETRTAVFHLRRAKFQVWSLLVEELIGSKIVKRPLFPGYILAQLPQQGAFQAVTATRGVRGIITKVGHLAPSALPTGLVDEWLAAADQDGVIKFQQPQSRIRAGDQVQALGLSAVVTQPGTKRSQLLVALFGRSVVAEVSNDQILCR